ncbi:MAG: hypothetical protein GQ531_04800 [Sulfurovum sp.]|nr:hypothetical protein [Sulfurovum sp.]
MSLLSIGKELHYDGLDIHSITLCELENHVSLQDYEYIIIHGGDGSIRRVVKILDKKEHQVKLILNPIGSFNVIAKMHQVPKFKEVLEKIVQKEVLTIKEQSYYRLNHEIFLFSAGNMGDVQHIFLSESLRFGWLKHGVAKYILAFLFLLPVHLIMTPFMLLSKRKFFIFTPASFIKKFGSFYGRVEPIHIDLGSVFHTLELDGDLVTIEEQILDIKAAGQLSIVT